MALASVILDGGAIVVRSKAAQESVSTAQTMELVIVNRSCASVIRAGSAMGARSPTAQVQIAMAADTATALLIHLNAPTARVVGWARHVNAHA